MRIINPEGIWVVNRCRFPMADPTQNLRYEPGEVTCVQLSKWLKDQLHAGVFKQVECPVPQPGRPQAVQKPR
jgi:hypothetical protein